MKKKWESWDFPLNLLRVTHDGTQDKPVTESSIFVVCNLFIHSVIPLGGVVLNECRDLTQI
jgi:hypothetical protein